MATMLLSAAGAAVGSHIGGSFLGLSTATIGRAIGASLGGAIDQSLMGGGSATIEQGRIERFRLSSAGEGAPLAQVYGRTRLAGHVIWASPFYEHQSTSAQGGGSGKGSSRPQPQVNSYYYTVSLALALCEGEITTIGRIWANGQEISAYDLNMRVYRGTKTQEPDSLITLHEQNTPAYRGMAYVVIEDLNLNQFGNTVPHFNFEVLRRAPKNDTQNAQDLVDTVQAVALIPGSGEYALATTPVYYDKGLGQMRSANIHTRAGLSDIEVSIDMAVVELPRLGAASLVVSWFGDDLRCGECTLSPRVEQRTSDGNAMAWSAGGITRSAAQKVPFLGARPAYGGTPADASVIQAIKVLNRRGLDVMFYPFILMDQTAGNGLPDPWNPDQEQPKFPWRGRITSHIAPALDGTSDKTAQVTRQIDDFFGTAKVNDFIRTGGQVKYKGPNEWSYRRFILHYAHLCKLAGGVEAFCIGSEMRGLTHLRDAQNNFPAVDKLISLAADVRTILGAKTKISYAADWSEYFGYHPQDGSGDVFFHLDPLWASSTIDFIGIDNYMPLSDWRDGAHLDANWGSIYSLPYLTQNVAGGEGFEWYYPGVQDRQDQTRRVIEDTAYQKHWVFRYKDIRAWWENAHYNRPGGVEQANTTAWTPASKPIRFTELGCAAVDKATNQPNVFLDAKSSESQLPYGSNGTRDDYIQMQYLRAVCDYWSDAQNNPDAQLYSGSMIDMAHTYVWAWDTRPYPAFPAAFDVWSDSVNYERGHWITGRSAAQPLAAVVRDICTKAGITAIDTSQLYGLVRGFSILHNETARGALQTLMLSYGFDAYEQGGKIIFKSRGLPKAQALEQDTLVYREGTPPLEHTRTPITEIANHVRLNYIDADYTFEVATAETSFPNNTSTSIASSDCNITFSPKDAQAITARWLAETRIARDRVRFVLPPSKYDVEVGDVVSFTEAGGAAQFRIDRVEMATVCTLEAQRIEQSAYATPAAAKTSAPRPPYPSKAATPLFSLFMDLPVPTQNGALFSPFVALNGDPWFGAAQIYHSLFDGNYAPMMRITQRATLGRTLNDLALAPAAVMDHGAPLNVQLVHGALSSLPHEAILAGSNMAVIGDGSMNNWEVFQFETAHLVATGQYALSKRLRGRYGTDALMPQIWPVGSYFVLLNSGVNRLELPETLLNIKQFFRIGAADKPFTDKTYRASIQVFEGQTLRPYAPVHLAAKHQDNGDLLITWVRRERLRGYDWQGQEMPLSEGIEQYHITLKAGEKVVREAFTQEPKLTYSAQQISADGVSGPLDIEIAQVSARYGAGLARGIQVAL